jgi:hypothetical protein
MNFSGARPGLAAVSKWQIISGDKRRSIELLSTVQLRRKAEVMTLKQSTYGTRRMNGLE